MLNVPFHYVKVFFDVIEMLCCFVDSRRRARMLSSTDQPQSVSHGISEKRQTTKHHSTQSSSYTNSVYAANIIEISLKYLTAPKQKFVASKNTHQDVIPQSNYHIKCLIPQTDSICTMQHLLKLCWKEDLANILLLHICFARLMKSKTSLSSTAPAKALG